jgi:sec-independent protein translocase protein TatA
MTHALVTPLLAGLGTQELIIIFAVLILLFGAKKLPELARGSGRALRIFKAETKGLVDDDDDDESKTPEQRQIDAQNRLAADAEAQNQAQNRAEHETRYDGPGASGTTR